MAFGWQSESSYDEQRVRRARKSRVLYQRIKVEMSRTFNQKNAGQRFSTGPISTRHGGPAHVNLCRDGHGLIAALL
jgi:hypothetical protein